jgi:hypothetical protein
MNLISVQIVRFVDSDFPGWVKCELVDSDRRYHTLKDKVPIFTIEPLDANSKYPTSGAAPCEPLERFQDERGRELARISTKKPCNIESSEGLSEFTILASQLSA